jgi:hypothetical protein
VQPDQTTVAPAPPAVGERHSLDLMSLAAGIVFVAVALTHLVLRAANDNVDGHWIGPALLIGVGVMLAAAAIRRVAARAPR